MASDWFISQGGKTYGPFQFPRLKELASGGKVSSSACIASSADGPWHPIAKVKELEIKESPETSPIRTPSIPAVETEHSNSNASAPQKPTDGWWRWPLVPIAAPIGAALGAIVVAFFQWSSMRLVGGYYTDGWYYLYIMPLINSGVFGGLWCSIASYVAPRGKTITGTVMATVLGMICILLTIFSFNLSHIALGDRIQMILATVAVIVGSVIALIGVHEEESKA